MRHAGEKPACRSDFRVTAVQCRHLTHLDHLASPRDARHDRRAHACSLQRPSAQPSDVSIDPQATECKTALVRRSEIPRLQRKVGATRRALDPQLSPSGKCRKAPAATHGGAPRSNPDRTQVLALADALCRRGARSPRRRAAASAWTSRTNAVAQHPALGAPSNRGSERPGTWKKYRTAALRVTRPRCPSRVLEHAVVRQPARHRSAVLGAAARVEAMSDFARSGNLRTPTWSASSMCRVSRDSCYAIASTPSSEPLARQRRTTGPRAARRANAAALRHEPAAPSGRSRRAGTSGSCRRVAARRRRAACPARTCSREPIRAQIVHGTR